MTHIRIRMMKSLKGEMMTAVGSVARALSVALAACVLAAGHPSAVLASGDHLTDFELEGNFAEGKQVYQRHCASCHGPKGAGDGREGQAFDPGPSDFTAIVADARRFYRATRDGGMAVGLAGTMPAFRHTLSDEEIRHVVAYLIRLAP